MNDLMKPYMDELNSIESSITELTTRIRKIRKLIKSSIITSRATDEVFNKSLKSLKKLKLKVLVINIRTGESSIASCSFSNTDSTNLIDLYYMTEKDISRLLKGEVVRYITPIYVDDPYTNDHLIYYSTNDKSLEYIKTDTVFKLKGGCS